MPVENSYGRVKRLELLREAIRRTRPDAVLDFGCGSGEDVTAPLAAEFPGCEFVGVDADPATVAWARERHRAPNLSFLLPHELPPGRAFALVLASEVLEHVDEPEALLGALRDRVAPRGRLVLTTPNGYGPFEAAAFVESVLTLAGLLPLLRGLKRRLRGAGPPARPAGGGTLAVSPHLCFFSWGDLGRMFARAGLRVERAEARTFLCGFGFDSVVRPGRVARWNAAVADRLPRRLVSAWSFELVPCEPRPDLPSFRPRAWGQLRRRLNRARWAPGG